MKRILAICQLYCSVFNDKETKRMCMKTCIELLAQAIKEEQEKLLNKVIQ